ncbi:hypothetical protein ACB092_08G172500 [Castanea dentata]
MDYGDIHSTPTSRKASHFPPPPLDMRRILTDIFTLVAASSSSPKRSGSGSDAFDDLLGGFGKVERESKGSGVHVKRSRGRRRRVCQILMICYRASVVLGFLVKGNCPN